ncbi:MAG TPA: YeeE/YedE thiosulfate transporter family protein [Candidatus Didemnitutus sp.]|nr:YeeE/YedE thiosulfate transporter family protein [Candidatus Didemnitutus sp.]
MQLPWYLSGILLGLAVPLALWFLKKPLGLSRNLEHICALFPPIRRISHFRYALGQHVWSLAVLGGIVSSGLIARVVLGVDFESDVVQWVNTENGTFILVVSGVLIGLGTRLAQGCTSGHGLTGIATRQKSSLIATATFFATAIGTFLFTSHILHAGFGGMR